MAAGLSRPHHDEIFRRLAPFLLPAKGTSPAKKAGRKKPEPHELAEMWRCAASLERLTPEIKESLGSVLLRDAGHGPRWEHTSCGVWGGWCSGSALWAGQHGRSQADR